MLDVMNAALVSQGFDEIVAANDGSDEWRVLSRNWPLIVEAELEDGNYHFTRQEMNLVTRQPGAFGYADAYVLPLNVLHVRALWTQQDQGARDLNVLWGQDGARVHVNCETGVYVDCAMAATSEVWSANFAKGVQMKLEAVLLRVKEEPSQAMEDLAMYHFERARTNSSRSRQVVPPLRESRFAAARFRRG